MGKFNLNGGLKEELKYDMINELKDEIINELRDELRDEIIDEIRDEIKDALKDEIMKDLLPGKDGSNANLPPRSFDTPKMSTDRAQQEMPEGESFRPFLLEVNDAFQHSNEMIKNMLSNFSDFGTTSSASRLGEALLLEVSIGAQIANLNKEKLNLRREIDQLTNSRLNSGCGTAAGTAPFPAPFSAPGTAADIATGTVPYTSPYTAPYPYLSDLLSGFGTGLGPVFPPGFGSQFGRGFGSGLGIGSNTGPSTRPGAWRSPSLPVYQNYTKY